MNFGARDTIALGTVSVKRLSLNGIVISIIKVRSHDRLMFIVESHTRKDSLYCDGSQDVGSRGVYLVFTEYSWLIITKIDMACVSNIYLQMG